MKSNLFFMFSLSFAIFMIGCKETGYFKGPDYSDLGEMTELKQLASKVFGVPSEKTVREGSQGNLFGFRTENVLVSKRTDSRTYFVHNESAGYRKPNGIFQGADAELVRVNRAIFKQLRISEQEIREEAVLQETLQTGQIEGNNGLKLENPERGQKILKASRKVENVPVFSSSSTLNLDKDGKVAYLELHWPVISPEILREAKRLEYKIKQGWKAPEQPGARVESVEVGIVHSSATAQLLDIYPVIRVIYAVTEDGIGRKPVYYFDRNGVKMPLTREMDITCPDTGTSRKN